MTQTYWNGWNKVKSKLDNYKVELYNKMCQVQVKVNIIQVTSYRSNFKEVMNLPIWHGLRHNHLLSKLANSGIVKIKKVTSTCCYLIIAFDERG